MSAPLTDEQVVALALLGLRPEPGTTGAEVVAYSIGMAIGAQIEEPDAPDWAVLDVLGQGAHEHWSELAGRVRAAVEQTLSAWLAEVDQ